MTERIIPKDFYVYMHLKTTTKEPFYIGKGRGRRATSPYSRSRHWKSVAGKHGFEVEFVQTNLSEAQAFDLERDLIKQHGRKDAGAGLLVNGTDGGEGVSGHRRTTESVAATHAGIRTKKAQFARVLCVDFGYRFPTFRAASDWMTACGLDTNANAIRTCVERGQRHKGLYFTAGKIGEGEPITPVSSMLDAKSVWDYAATHRQGRGALISATKKKSADITRMQTLERMRKDPTLIKNLLLWAAKNREKTKRAMVCRETGAVFKGLPAIADWLFTTTGKKTDAKSVWTACNGKTKSAYGYTWAYA